MRFAKTHCIINRLGAFINNDQIKGTLKEGLGKVQKTVGKVIGSGEQRAKGIEKEVEGKAQKNIGDAEERAREWSKKA